MVSRTIKSIFVGIMLALSATEVKAQELSQVAEVAAQPSKSSQKAIAIFEGHIQELKARLVDVKSLLNSDEVTEKIIDQARLIIKPYRGKIEGLRKEVEVFGKQALISAQDARVFLERLDDL